MIKKFVALFCVLLSLCSCSKESKFGIEQFVSRINEQYETTYKTADFLFGTDTNGKPYLFYDCVDGLIALSLDNNNDIIGVSLLINESIDIKDGINSFCNICSVFTGNDEHAQKKNTI